MKTKNITRLICIRVNVMWISINYNSPSYARSVEGYVDIILYNRLTLFFSYMAKNLFNWCWCIRILSLNPDCVSYHFSFNFHTMRRESLSSLCQGNIFSLPSFLKHFATNDDDDESVLRLFFVCCFLYCAILKIILIIHDLNEDEEEVRMYWK